MNLEYELLVSLDSYGHNGERWNTISVVLAGNASFIERWQIMGTWTWKKKKKKKRELQRNAKLVKQRTLTWGGNKYVKLLNNVFQITAHIIKEKHG